MKILKLLRKLGAFACALSFVFALSACGGGGSGGEPAKTEDTAKLLADAEKKVIEAKSMQADMTMDMDMTVEAEGQTNAVKTTTQMKMLMFNNPMKIKMDMAMKMDLGEELGANGVQDIKMSMYMVENNGTYTMYTQNGTQWTSQTLDSTAIEQYDPQASMSLYLKSAESFQAAGEETINGEKTQKYTGVISNEAMNEVMSATGVASTLNGMGMEGVDWNAIYTDMGNLPITIWINEQGYPVRYQMDMTEMMNKLYAKMIEQLGEEAVGGKISCSKVFISMDISNYDKVEAFELPAEIQQ